MISKLSFYKGDGPKPRLKTHLEELLELYAISRCHFDHPKKILVLDLKWHTDIAYSSNNNIQNALSFNAKIQNYHAQLFSHSPFKIVYSQLHAILKLRTMSNS